MVPAGAPMRRFNGTHRQNLLALSSSPSGRLPTESEKNGDNIDSIKACSKTTNDLRTSFHFDKVLQEMSSNCTHSLAKRLANA